MHAAGAWSPLMHVSGLDAYTLACAPLERRIGEPEAIIVMIDTMLLCRPDETILNVSSRSPGKSGLL
jgi:hypothetical protein